MEKDDMYSLSESEAKEYYKLVQVDKRQWKHGPVWQKSFKIDLVKGLPSGHLGLIWLEDIIKSAISQVTSEAKPGLCLFCVFPCELLFFTGARGQLCIENEELHTECFSSKRVPIEQLSCHSTLARLGDAVQSASGLTIQNTRFTVNVVEPFA